jgi:hypothetical protein
MLVVIRVYSGKVYIVDPLDKKSKEYESLVYMLNR